MQLSLSIVITIAMNRWAEGRAARGIQHSTQCGPEKQDGHSGHCATPEIHSIIYTHNKQ